MGGDDEVVNDETLGAAHPGVDRDDDIEPAPQPQDPFLLGEQGERLSCPGAEDLARIAHGEDRPAFPRERGKEERLPGGQPLSIRSCRWYHVSCTKGRIIAPEDFAAVRASGGGGQGRNPLRGPRRNHHADRPAGPMPRPQLTPWGWPKTLKPSGKSCLSRPSHPQRRLRRDPRRTKDLANSCLFPVPMVRGVLYCPRLRQMDT